VKIVDSDLLIIGGGPAGSSSAFQAAKNKTSTIILEEHKEIGVPCHCTGHISETGLRSLKLDLPQNVFENKIKAATFYSPSGRRFTVNFPHPVTCVVDRRVFDQHLLKKALDAGAQHMNGSCVYSLLIDKGYVKGVKVRQNNRIKEFKSKIVIDAEGVFSSVIRRAGIPALNPRLLVQGVQAEANNLKEVQDDTVEIYLGHSFAPGFFAWIVPKRDGTAKVGLAAEKGKNPRECFHHFTHHHPIASEKFKRSTIKNPIYHPIPLGGPIPRTYYNGLLITGDAASQVKPTTGGGLVMGITCAKLAGEVAAEAIQSQDYSERFLSIYESRWREKIGFDIQAMKFLRILINMLPDKRLDRLIATCTQVKLDETLKEVKDIDFQGTSLIRLARNPRALATALYFLMLFFF
jgi:digeranylgeranylglycerophospholipid reductase